MFDITKGTLGSQSDCQTAMWSLAMTMMFILSGMFFFQKMLFIIPLVYEVYRGYIVFAFSVIMFVCLYVCLYVNFFFVRFLRNYLT